MLVAYFSASGVTESVAKEIASECGAVLYQIKPREPYTAADLDWLNKKSRSTLEMTDPSSRPEIADKVQDFDKHQTILVGFPVWWYVEPRIIDTFMESYDFSGKTVIPFATSGGSGIEKAQAKLKAQYPTANWKAGKLLSLGNAAAWARSLVK